MRACCTGDVTETMYTELPSCGRLLALCNDIATARHHRDLVTTPLTTRQCNDL